MKKWRNIPTLVLVLCLSVTVSLTASCRRSSADLVTLAGSTAFQPFAEKLAEKYMEENKQERINVQGGGSAVGIQAALSGAANIGMADLLELPAEAKNLHSTIVAKDGIAIIVNPANQTRNASLQQVKDIFSGKITNWKDVGGEDLQINVVSREDGSGTRTTFDTIILKNGSLAKEALFQNSNGTVREAVAQDRGAIGYISISLVNDKVASISLDGVAATNANVKSGKYNLARPVFFLTKEENNQRVEKFINFVLSEKSQETLEEEGLIAVK